MKPMTKTELLATLAEKSGIEKKDVSSVLDALSEVATSTVAEGGPSHFLAWASSCAAIVPSGRSGIRQRARP